jgi:hypothetical protein
MAVASPTSVKTVGVKCGHCKKNGHRAEECRKNKRDIEAKKKGDSRKKQGRRRRDKNRALFDSDEVRNSPAPQLPTLIQTTKVKHQKEPSTGSLTAAAGVTSPVPLISH